MPSPLLQIGSGSSMAALYQSRKACCRCSVQIKFLRKPDFLLSDMYADMQTGGDPT